MDECTRVHSASVGCRAESMALYRLGLFGNTIQQWDSYDEMMAAPYDGPIVIRAKGGLGGSLPCRYGVPKGDVASVLREPEWSSIPRDLLFFNEEIPVEAVRLNAEVMRTHRGLYLYYSTVRAHMRDALKFAPQHAEGLRALLILRRSCCEQGYACLNDLLSLFPDAVIEVTCLDRAVGDRQWRTVIWEVREY